MFEVSPDLAVADVTKDDVKLYQASGQYSKIEVPKEYKFISMTDITERQCLYKFIPAS